MQMGWQASLSGWRDESPACLEKKSCSASRFSQLDLYLWRVRRCGTRVRRQREGKGRREIHARVRRSTRVTHSGRSTIVGQLSSVGVPRALKIFSSWSWSLVPGKSGRPEFISPKIQPTLQRSTGVEYFREPMRTSGARYHSVTTWTEQAAL